mgnify:CR=1 FL=1
MIKLSPTSQENIDFWNNLFTKMSDEHLEKQNQRFFKYLNRKNRNGIRAVKRNNQEYIRRCRK